MPGLCAAHGFRTLKVKGGQGLATDLDALAQIRCAVGPEVELFIDANGACPRDEAIEYVQRIALGTAINAQYATALEPGRAVVAAEQSFHLMLADQVTSAPLSIKDGMLGLSALPAPAAMIDRAQLQRFAA